MPAECFGGDAGGSLVAHGIITTQQDPTEGRKLTYVLTRKGIDLAPVLTEMVLWAARHEETENQALVRLMQKDKEQFLASVRQRWAAQENACDRQLNFSPRIFSFEKSKLRPRRWRRFTPGAT